MLIMQLFYPHKEDKQNEYDFWIIWYFGFQEIAHTS